MRLAPAMFEYEFDPEYAQQLISQYKDLLWLVVSLLSTFVVIYGILVPQRNNNHHKKLEATLSIMERWTGQGLAHALLEYQQQVIQDHACNISSESKSRLCSFYHTIALLIRENKVDEALIRKSQIGISFLCFYAALAIEQPSMLEKQTFYGRDFLGLYRRWRGLAKLPRHYQKEQMLAVSQKLFVGLANESPSTQAAKAQLRVLPRV
jgi:hypothetical protein